MLIRLSRYLTLGLAVAVLMLTGCSDDKPVVASPESSAETLIAQGSQKSRMCTGCHGPNGISRVASYPSLAGQSEAYISEQLHAFRSGTRENPMMSSISTSLSDDDILALAAYYSSQPKAPGATNPEAQQ